MLVVCCCTGVPTSFPTSDVFGDMSDLGGVNSKISPRACALAVRHPTSDPNPMGNFARQPPSSMGGPGTPPATAAQSALLSQQLHAAAVNADESAAGAASTHPQRSWAVADMTTPLGLERLYQQGERASQGQNPVEAVYGAADRQQHPHSSVAAAVNTANALRGTSGLPQRMPQHAHLTSPDRPPGAAQRMSMDGEEPSNGSAGGVGQHIHLSPPGAQAGFASAGAAQGAQVDPTQAGAAGNDPFLQLLQGLKVAKALQGTGETEESQCQDSHYHALVQMLTQRNVQMPPTRSLPGGTAGAAGTTGSTSSVPSLPQHPSATSAQEGVGGPAGRSFHSVVDGRLNANVGSQGAIAGLEDMHALASLVAHSAGTPAAHGGGAQAAAGAYAGLTGGLGGSVKAEPHHQSVTGSGGDIRHAGVAMQDSAAPPPPFNGGSGAAWDVGGKQMQVCSSSFWPLFKGCAHPEQLCSVTQ